LLKRAGTVRPSSETVLIPEEIAKRRVDPEIQEKVHWPLPSFASDTGLPLSLYRGMVLTRAFDLKAVSRGIAGGKGLPTT
jgi:hypothetical protein